ncbi:MAG: MBL fold metallo-hydrolase [Chloroflexota bacterium]
MSQEIMPGLYRIEVPLAGNPLKSVNSYLVRSGERPLIIDTALNRPECRDWLLGELGALGVDPAGADFFLTHRHGDHRGLVSNLAGAASKVYIGQAEIDFIRTSGYGERRIPDEASRNGFSRHDIEKTFRNPQGSPDTSTASLNYRPLKEGNVLSVGGYRFRCLETPGHSPGHLCLYEPEKKLLVAGDHIMAEISPNVSAWFNNGSPLHDYLSSLDKVLPLEVRLVLPGHRQPFRNFRGRVRELKRHHRARTREVLGILGDGESQHAYQVASRIGWDSNYPSWQEFPVVQRWFATGEAMAHLRFLERQGKVRRHTGCGQDRYSLA